jgi:hypothetical protein
MVASHSVADVTNLEISVLEKVVGPNLIMLINYLTSSPSDSAMAPNGEVLFAFHLNRSISVD